MVYENERFVKKIFDIAAILQCLYYFGCIVGMIGWQLYRSFYPSDFSEICFRISAYVNIYSCLSPAGLVAWILSLVVFCREHSKLQNKKTKLRMIIWLVISLVIIVLCWRGAAATFMLQVSGV